MIYSFEIIMVFLFGLAIGSFLNVVIYRVPKGENIAFPASHCPKCNHTLNWYHNIPLLSWIFLQGKCAFCKENISFRYPAVELINALLWVVVFIKTGANWEFPFIAITFSALLALTMIDFDYFAVPDSINLFALGSAIAAKLAQSIQSGDWHYFIYGIGDALIAGGGLWLLGWIVSKVAKKEAMGEADVIVAGTMAAILGLPGFFVALFISALLAIFPSLIAKDTMVPFIPFLSMGTLIVYLFENPILKALERFIYG